MLVGRKPATAYSRPKCRACFGTGLPADRAPRRRRVVATNCKQTSSIAMGLLDTLQIAPRKFSSWIRNVASNYLDVAVSGASFFFLTPYIVHQVGLPAYSLWIVCHTIAFYLRFFDLGFGQAQIRYQAKFHARGRTDLGRQLLSTTVSALLIASTFACATGVVLASGVRIPGVAIPPEMQHDFTLVLLLLAANLLVSIPGSALSNIYYGTERFDIANARSIVLQLLSAALQFTALQAGQGIVVLAAIELGISILRVLVDVIVLRRLYPQLLRNFRPGFARIIWRRVGRFALWSSLDDLLVEGTSQLDRVFIAVFLPLATLAPYALCKSVGGMVSLIIEPMTQTFYPMAAGLHAKGNREKLTQLLLAGTKTATAIALPLALALALFGDNGLALWVPEIFAVAPPLLIAFIAANLLLSVFMWTSTVLLLATNRARTVAFITLGEISLAFVCIAFLTRQFGLTGIAMGSLTANIIMVVVVQIPLVCRVMKISPRTFLFQTVGRVALAAFPVIAFALWLRRSFAPDTWVSLGAVAAAILLAFALSFIVLGITTSERKQYLTVLKDYLHGTEPPADHALSESVLR